MKREEFMKPKREKAEEKQVRKVRVRLRAGDDPHVFDAETGEELSCNVLEIRGGKATISYAWYDGDALKVAEAEVVRIEGIWTSWVPLIAQTAK
jgi:hypothetical protein